LVIPPSVAQATAVRTGTQNPTVLADAVGLDVTFGVGSVFERGIPAHEVLAVCIPVKVALDRNPGGRNLDDRSRSGVTTNTHGRAVTNIEIVLIQFHALSGLIYSMPSIISYPETFVKKIERILLIKTLGQNRIYRDGGLLRTRVHL